MYKMKCEAMNYAWGRKGENSFLSSILKANSIPVDQSKCYAEYWMGTHPNGPSSIYSSKTSSNVVPLSSLINKQLPYLFKVLSIEIPLSIQLHPDKTTATQLHNKFPTIYKDANHKPELFVAISDTFELLFGFKPIDAAYNTVQAYKNFFTFEEANNFICHKSIDLYQKFIDKLLSLSKNEYEPLIKSLVEFCKNSLSNEETESIKEEKRLLSKLQSHFGNDLGILTALFMNHLVKKKGDSMFISPNIPHAYISGNCFEVMANSDNVIRLGLTPKFVDKDNFKAILDINFSEMTFEPLKNDANDHCHTDGHDSFYHKDGFDDFVLRIIGVNSNQKQSGFIGKESIVFVQGGDVEFSFGHETMLVKEYESVFVPNTLNDLSVCCVNGNHARLLIVSEMKKD